MNDDVPHAAHLGPGNTRITLLYILRYVTRGLADDAYVAHHGIDGHLVAAKLFEGHAVGVAFDLANGLQDIF